MDEQLKQKLPPVHLHAPISEKPKSAAQSHDNSGIDDPFPQSEQPDAQDAALPSTEGCLSTPQPLPTFGDEKCADASPIHEDTDGTPLPIDDVLPTIIEEKVDMATENTDHSIHENADGDVPHDNAIASSLDTDVEFVTLNVDVVVPAIFKDGDAQVNNAIIPNPTQITVGHYDVRSEDDEMYDNINAYEYLAQLDYDTSPSSSASSDTDARETENDTDSDANTRATSPDGSLEFDDNSFAAYGWKSGEVTETYHIFEGSSDSEQTSPDKSDSLTEPVPENRIPSPPDIAPFGAPGALSSGSIDSVVKSSKVDGHAQFWKDMSETLPRGKFPSLNDKSSTNDYQDYS
jgi:hypothetical protein